MAAITGAFSMYYKRIQSGSVIINEPWNGNLAQTWWNVDSTGVSSSFLNFPKDTLATTYLTTRDSGSNQFYRALPWGNAACDFLWNCTVPSWSYEDSSSVVPNWEGSGPDETIVDRYWKVNMYTSRSFYRDNLAGVSSFGVASYPITSSWTAVDAKFFATASNTGYSGAVFRYLHSTASQPIYPTYIGSRYLSPAEPDRSNEIAYDITWPNKTGNARSAIDSRYFDIGSGIGITRGAVSQSLVTMSINQSATSGNGLKDFRAALKQRRLFCPILVSGSGTTQGTDYWFKLNTSYNSSEIFDTNGGIYNIQFTLKKYTDNTDYYPDNSTFMTVFIHDVQTDAPVPSERFAGAAGWYPPQNNMVVIGNGYGLAPQMTFNEPQSGHKIEQFNFTAIQYGYPAQLCIEVSGSLADDKYFGIIVDDIRICKIGVTTDPRFIKPTTINTIVQNTAGGEYEAPVYEPPGEES
jgi:hypothetical protein